MQTLGIVPNHICELQLLITFHWKNAAGTHDTLYKLFQKLFCAIKTSLVHEFSHKLMNIQYVYYQRAPSCFGYISKLNYHLSYLLFLVLKHQVYREHDFVGIQLTAATAD